MNRPIQRPSQPLTIKQIWQNVYQHFVVDKMPQCFDKYQGCCIYSNTGCAVGLNLTKTDADFFDKDNLPIEDMKMHCPDIYKIYFDNNNNTMYFLQRIQKAHDLYVISEGAFSEYMKDELEAIKEEFGL